MFRCACAGLYARVVLVFLLDTGWHTTDFYPSLSLTSSPILSLISYLSSSIHSVLFFVFIIPRTPGPIRTRDPTPPFLHYCILHSTCAICTFLSSVSSSSVSSLILAFISESYLFPYAYPSVDIDNDVFLRIRYRFRSAFQPQDTSRVTGPRSPPDSLRL